MPELPEVEVTRASLAPHVEGAVVQAAQLGKPLRWPLGIDPGALCGATLGMPARRGKYLWLPLMPAGRPSSSVLRPNDQSRAGSPAGAPGEVLEPADGWAPPGPGLLIHLGMSGSLRFGAALPPRGAHDHFELQTDRGLLRLTDPRRFGAVIWSPDPRLDPARRLLAGLGVEPLSQSFTASVLHAGLAHRRVAIKLALLAGDLVVGVGNIYCSEALFEARIDPRAPAQRLSLARCERLVRAIRATLERALAAGGSTLKDFRDVHGMGGEFQLQARVYGRTGQPCGVCGRPIRRLVQAQRATFFCAHCQRF